MTVPQPSQAVLGRVPLVEICLASERAQVLQSIPVETGTHGSVINTYIQTEIHIRLQEDS